VGGFPCVSKSRSNNKRSIYATCIADGTGATGMGVQAMVRCRHYI
jgi:hypothetical protein